MKVNKNACKQAKGKIIKAVSGFYYVEEEKTHQVFQTRARGQFRNKKQSPLVGDYVQFNAESLTEGVIQKIDLRHNEVKRPPLANVDVALIVCSVSEPVISERLIDRLLVYVASLEIQPILLLTKLDIATPKEQEQAQKYKNMYQDIGYVIFENCEVATNPERLMPYTENKTMMVMGQSGVGKSTFINLFLNHKVLPTAAISKALGRGRHTTRHVELHDALGGKLADTPGFSSLEIKDIDLRQLDTYFPEMKMRRLNCKFRGCTHRHEPQCAIKDAVRTGEIYKERYDSYIVMYEQIDSEPIRYH